MASQNRCLLGSCLGNGGTFRIFRCPDVHTAADNFKSNESLAQFQHINRRRVVDPNDIYDYFHCTRVYKH